MLEEISFLILFHFIKKLQGHVHFKLIGALLTQSPKMKVNFI